MLKSKIAPRLIEQNIGKRRNYPCEQRVYRAQGNIPCKNYGTKSSVTASGKLKPQPDIYFCKQCCEADHCQRPYGGTKHRQPLADILLVEEQRQAKAPYQVINNIRSKVCRKRVLSCRLKNRGPFYLFVNID
jgi:hypothetical protein